MIKKTNKTKISTVLSFLGSIRFSGPRHPVYLVRGTAKVSVEVKVAEPWSTEMFSLRLFVFGPRYSQEDHAD